MLLHMFLYLRLRELNNCVVISIGVHIFQFDHTQPDSVAVNVYCIEDENFEELKVRPRT